MGGVDSGGGTLFVKGNKTVLLDFHNFPFGAAGQAGLIVSKNTQCRLETFRIRDLPFADYINDLMNPFFEAISDQKLQAFEDALNTLHFMFVDAEFTPEALDLKAYAKNSDKPYLVPVAIYIKGHGVLISLPLFNKLALRDQLGLLIHETLRQVSLGFELAISDQHLQELTSVIMSKQTMTLLEREKKDFEKAGLPDEVFDGILTSHSVRADLNYFCSYSKGQGHSLGQGCLALTTTDTEDVYKILPSVRKEALQNYASSREDSTSAEQNTSWKNILKRVNSFRQLRISSMRAHPPLVFRAFSSASLQRQEASESAQMCMGFINALAEENLIKN